MSDGDKRTSFPGDPPATAQEGLTTARRELALVAVERTRMPMVVSDPNQPDNPIILANLAFLDLTGYSAEEVIGRNCRFLQGPDTDPADVDQLREALVRNDDHIQLELLNYRKDSSPFWNQLVISAVRNADGHRHKDQRRADRRGDAQHGRTRPDGGAAPHDARPAGVVHERLHRRCSGATRAAGRRCVLHSKPFTIKELAYRLRAVPDSRNPRR